MIECLSYVDPGVENVNGYLLFAVVPLLGVVLCFFLIANGATMLR